MTTHAPSKADLANSLATISGLLISEEKLEAILELVTALTSRTLPNADGVSVTLVQDGRYTSAVYTNELTRRVDSWQYTTGQGPCLSALKDRHAYMACDLPTETRWAGFAPMAVDEGVLSIMAIPLKPMGEPIGTLNIYSSERAAFDEAHLDIASLFAQQAAIVLANAMAYSSEQLANGQLREALESRELIGQAKGILMARERCSADAAFDILREVSQRTNRKLREVAQDVVDSV